jgi:hypothetical protein
MENDKNTEPTITDIVESVLSTSQAIDDSTEFVTDIIKKVANNKAFKKSFLKVLNDKKATLTLDDLTTFGEQIHKMQKLIAKVNTQKAICEHLKLDPKEVRYSIRIVKSDDINSGTHTEDQRGQYFEFWTEKEPPKDPAPISLVEAIANWQENNEPDGLINPDRPAYNNELLEAKAYLTELTIGMEVSK